MKGSLELVQVFAQANKRQYESKKINTGLTQAAALLKIAFASLKSNVRNDCLSVLEEPEEDCGIFLGLIAWIVVTKTQALPWRTSYST